MNQRRKTILVLCPYPFQEAAGQRLKYEQYFDSWRKSGFEISLSPYMDQKLWNVVYKKGHYLTKVIGVVKGYLKRVKDIFRLRSYDIIYIHQWTTPFGTTFYDRIVRGLAKRIIFDLEDFVVFKKQLNESRDPILKYIRSNGKILYMIKNSDYVITSSPNLNKYCLSENKFNSSTFISSSVDTNRFVPTNTYENDHKIVIGWTGTFSSMRYLNLLREVFVKLSSHCEFKLRVISNCDYSFPEIDLELIQWSKEKEVEDLQGIDIGVYPLENNNWVLGKSGLKAIQYMAFGIPTVATDVGTSSEIINHMENGWLVRTDEEWFEALKTLIENADLRRQLGVKSRENIVGKYSLEAIESQYLNILNKT